MLLKSDDWEAFFCVLTPTKRQIKVLSGHLIVTKSLPVFRIKKGNDFPHKSKYNHLMEMDGYVMPDKIKNTLLGIEEKGKTIMFYFDK